MNVKILSALLVVGSTVVSLTAANAIYRYFEPITQREFFFGRPYVFFQYDPVFGWSHKPGAEGVMETPEFRTDVRINSAGMRYHEVGPKKSFRVAVVGDSFIWGYGVNEEDRFSDLIEKKLGVEILNFGVSGYGPVQYNMLLDRVLEFEPDLVIAGIYLGNDFDDNINNYCKYYRPYAALDEGKLVIKGYPIPNIRQFDNGAENILRHVALGRLLLSAAILPRNDSPDFLPNYCEFIPYKDHPGEGVRVALETFNSHFRPPRINYAAAVMVEALEAMRQKTDARKIPLVLLAIPANRAESPAVLRLLRRVATQADIPLVSKLQEVLVPADYFVMDGHWKPSGQQKVVDTLIPVIEQYRGEAKK